MAKVCPNCGSTIEANDRFCTTCGAALQASVSAEADSATPRASKSNRIDRSTLIWLGAGFGAIVLVASALIYWLRVGDTVPPGTVGSPAPATMAETLRTRLVGRTDEGNQLDDELVTEGWEDLGGGLLIEPIWFHYFRRKDGAYLVLANMAPPREPDAMYLPFTVTDVLVIPPLKMDQEVSFNCRPVGTKRKTAIVAVIEPDYANQKEWWKDIRQAWTISMDSGQFAAIDSDGIECANEAWGL